MAHSSVSAFQGSNQVFPPVGSASRRERTRFMPYGVLPADIATEDVAKDQTVDQVTGSSDVVVPKATIRRKRHGEPVARSGTHGNVLVLDDSDDEGADEDGKAGAIDGGHQSDDDDLLVPATGGITSTYMAPLLASSKPSRVSGAKAKSASKMSHANLTRKYIEARRAKTGKQAAAIILGEPEPGTALPCCCGRLGYLSCAMAVLTSIVVLLGAAYPLLRFVAGPSLASHTTGPVLLSASAKGLRLGSGMAASGTSPLSESASPDLQYDLTVTPWHTWYADPRPVVEFGSGAKAFLLDASASCPTGAAIPASPSSDQLNLGLVEFPQLSMPDPSASAVPLTMHRIATPDSSMLSSVVTGANVNATSLLAAAALSRRTVCIIVSAPAAQVTVSALPGVSGFLRHTYPSPVLVAWPLDTGAESAFASDAKVESFVVQQPPEKHAAALPDAAAWLGMQVTLQSPKRVSIADMGALRLAVVVNDTFDSAWLMATAAADAADVQTSSGPGVMAPLLPFPGFSKPVLWSLEGPLFQSDAKATSALLDELSDDGKAVPFTVVGQAAVPQSAQPSPSASSLVGGGVYGRALAVTPASVAIPHRVPPIVEGLRIFALDVAPPMPQSPPLSASTSDGGSLGAASEEALVNVTLAFTVRNPVAAFVPVSAAKVSLDVDLLTGTGTVLGRLVMAHSTASPLAPLPVVPTNSSKAASALPCQLSNGTWSSGTASGDAGDYACIQFSVSALTHVDLSAEGGAAWGDFVSELVTATGPVALQLRSRSDEPGPGGIGHAGIDIVTDSPLGEDIIVAPVEATSANSTPAAGFQAAPSNPVVFTASTTESRLLASIDLSVTNPATVSFDLGPNFVAALTSSSVRGAALANLTAPAGTSFNLVQGVSTVSLGAPLPQQPVAGSLDSLLSDFSFGRRHSVHIHGISDSAPGNSSSSPGSGWLDQVAHVVSFTTALQPAQQPTAVTAAALTGVELDLSGTAPAAALGASAELSPLRIPLPLSDLSVPTARDVAVRLSSDGSVCFSASSLPASFSPTPSHPAVEAVSEQAGVSGNLGLSIPAGTAISDCPSTSGGAAAESPSQLQLLVDSILRSEETVALPFDGVLSFDADTAFVAGLQLRGMPLQGVGATMCSVQIGGADAATVTTFEMSAGSVADSVDVSAELTLTPAATGCDTTVTMPETQFDVLVVPPSVAGQTRDSSPAQTVVTLTVPSFKLYGGKAGSSTKLTATGTITTKSASQNAGLRAVISAAMSGETVPASLQPRASANPSLATALAAIQYSVVLPTSGGMPGSGQLLRAASISVDQFVTGSASTPSSGSVTLSNPLGVGICLSHGSISVSVEDAAVAKTSVSLFTATVDTTFVPSGGTVQANASISPASVGKVVEPVAAALMQSAFFSGAYNAADPTKPLAQATIGSPSASGYATVTLAAASGKCVEGIPLPVSLSSPALSLTLNAPEAGSAASTPLVAEQSATNAYVDLTDSSATDAAPQAGEVASPSLGATVMLGTSWARPASGAEVSVTSAAISVLLETPTSDSEASATPMAVWTVAASSSGHTLEGSSLTLSLPVTPLDLPSANADRTALTPFAEAILGQDKLTAAAGLHGYANVTVAITPASPGTAVAVEIPFVPLTGPLVIPSIGLAVQGLAERSSTASAGQLGWTVESFELGDLTTDGASLEASGAIVVSNSFPVSVVLPSPLNLDLLLEESDSTDASAGSPAGSIVLHGAPMRQGGSPVVALLAGASEPLSFTALLTTWNPSFGKVLETRISRGDGEALPMSLQGQPSTSSDPVISRAAALISTDLTVPPPGAGPAVSADALPLMANISIDCNGFLDASGEASLIAGLGNFLGGSSGATTVELVSLNTSLGLCPTKCGPNATVQCCAVAPPSSMRFRATALPHSAGARTGADSGSDQQHRHNLRWGSSDGEHIATWAETVNLVLPAPSQPGIVTPKQKVAVPKTITVGADIMAAVAAGQGGVGRAVIGGQLTVRLTPPAAADGSVAPATTLTLDVVTSGVAIVATGFPHGTGGGGSGGTPPPAPPADPAKVQKYVNAFAAHGRSEYKSSQFHGYYDGGLGLGWDIVSGGIPGAKSGMGALPALFFTHTHTSPTMSGQLLPDDVTFTRLPPAAAKTVPAAYVTSSAKIWEGIAPFAADVSSAAAGQLSTTPGARPGVLTESSMASSKAAYFNGASTLGQAVLELHAYELDGRANVLAGKIEAHPMWLASLTSLPSTYESAADKQSWGEFLSQWGSHITVSTTTGGLVHCYAQFDYGLLQTNPWDATFSVATATAAMQEQCARTTGIGSTGQWAGIPTPSAAQKVFEAHISGKGASSLGGNPTDWHPGDQAKITSWLESVMVAPGIVRASVIGADELAKVWAPSKAKALSAAIAEAVATGEADWAPGKVATCPSKCTNGACKGSADSCSCTNSHQFGRLCQSCETGWITASCATPDCRSQGNCNEPNGHCSSPGKCSCNSCWGGAECMTYTCGCFGVNTTVEVEGKGPSTAGSLQVGDSVRSVDSSGRLVWSPVYHVNRPGPGAEINASLVDVRVAPQGADSLTLRVTAEHLVYVVKPSALSRLLSAELRHELLRGSGMLACSETACPTVSDAGEVPASLVRAGDVVLAAPDKSGTVSLRRVLGVELARGDGVVTVHTLAGPVVADGIVASSYECDSNHGYWDSVDLRTAYQVAPWLAKAGWFREAVAWADRVVYDGSPSLARVFGAVVPLDLRDAEAELFPATSLEAASGSTSSASEPAPPAQADGQPNKLPAPYCPDGSRGRAVLEE